MKVNFMLSNASCCYKKKHCNNTLSLIYKFTNKLIFSKFFLVLLLFFSFFLVSSPVYSYSDNNYIILNENWQYYIGDLPIESDGSSFLIEKDNLEWHDIESMENYMEKPTNSSTAWLRVKIPDANCVSPAIYFEEIYGQSISMFINGRLIFDTGDTPLYSDKNTVIVPLISEDYEDYLYIRISSNDYHRFGPVNGIYIGDHQKLSFLFLKDGYVSELIGFSLVFLSIVLLIAAFFITGPSKKIVISLCPVLACMGLVYIVQFSNFVRKFPRYDWVFNGYFSTLILASLFSITYFFKQIFGPGRKKIINISLNITIVVFFIMLLHNLDIFVLSYHAYIYILGGWSLISMIILIASAIYNSFKGNTDAKIFIAGLCGFAIVLIIEMLTFLFYSTSYRFSLFQWGIFIFIFAQILILARKITSFHNKTILYSKRLEKKNIQ